MIEQVKMSEEEKKAFDEGCERLKATYDEHMFKECYMSETELKVRMFIFNMFTLLLLPIKITLNNELRLCEYFVYCEGEDDDEDYINIIRRLRIAKRWTNKHYLLAWMPGWIGILPYLIYCKIKHLENDKDREEYFDNNIFSKYE